MGIYAELIILYIVLFFSGSFLLPFEAEPAYNFTVISGLAGIFLYNIPSLALIWHLLLKEKKAKDWDIRPSMKDLPVIAITLPCLIVTSLFFSGLASLFESSSEGSFAGSRLLFSAPSSPAQWTVLCTLLVSAAYLEESFFRFYILSRKNELKINTACAVAVSAALFSVCHIYEGLWGFLNSCAAGVILALIFLRFNKLHGIAIAHGLYNIALIAAYSFTAG